MKIISKTNSVLIIFFLLIKFLYADPLVKVEEPPTLVVRIFSDGEHYVSVDDYLWGSNGDVGATEADVYEIPLSWSDSSNLTSELEIFSRASGLDFELLSGYVVADIKYNGLSYSTDASWGASVGHHVNDLTNEAATELAYFNELSVSLDIAEIPEDTDAKAIWGSSHDSEVTFSKLIKLAERPVPAAPRDFRVDFKDLQTVILMWTPVWDDFYRWGYVKQENVDSLSRGFKIYRGTHANNIKYYKTIYGAEEVSYEYLFDSSGPNEGVYYYQISAFIEDDESERTEVQKFLSYLPALAVNVFDHDGDYAAKLSWTYGDDAESFSIYRTKSIFGEFPHGQLIATVPGSSFTMLDEDLELNQTYSYRVRATDVGGALGLLSDPVEILTGSPVDAVGDLIVYDGGNSLVLNWSADSKALTGFFVKRSWRAQTGGINQQYIKVELNDENLVEFPLNLFQWIDRDFPPHVEKKDIRYDVFAMNEGIVAPRYESPHAGFSGKILAPSQLKREDISFHDSSSGERNDLIWNYQAILGFDIKEFEVYMKKGFGEYELYDTVDWEAETTSDGMKQYSSDISESVGVGGVFSFKVRAVSKSEGRLSDFSNEITFSIVPLPAAPENLIMIKDDSKILLNWNHDLENVDTFVVYRSIKGTDGMWKQYEEIHEQNPLSNGAIFSPSDGLFEMFDVSLEPDVELRNLKYRVVAKNKTGASPMREVVGVNGFILAPESLRSSLPIPDASGKRSVTLAWFYHAGQVDELKEFVVLQKNGNDGEFYHLKSDVPGQYVINDLEAFQSIDGFQDIEVPSGLSLFSTQIKGLEGGETYSYAIVAKSVYDTFSEDHSNTVILTANPGPAVPKNLISVQEFSQVDLSWEHDREGLTGFIIQRSLLNGDNEFGPYEIVLNENLSVSDGEISNRPSSNLFQWSDKNISIPVPGLVEYRIYAKGGSSFSKFIQSSLSDATLPSPLTAPLDLYSNNLSSVEGGYTVDLNFSNRASQVERVKEYELFFTYSLDADWQRVEIGPPRILGSDVRGNILYSTAIKVPEAGISYFKFRAKSTDGSLSSFSTILKVVFGHEPRAPFELSFRYLVDEAFLPRLHWSVLPSDLTGFRIERGSYDYTINEWKFKPIEDNFVPSDLSVQKFEYSVDLFSDDTMEFGDLYEYRISSLNGRFVSKVSDGARVFVPVPAPTDLRYSKLQPIAGLPNFSDVILEWTYPEEYFERGVDQFIIYKKNLTTGESEEIWIDKRHRSTVSEPKFRVELKDQAQLYNYSIVAVARVEAGLDKRESRKSETVTVEIPPLDSSDPVEPPDPTPPIASDLSVDAVDFIEKSDGIKILQDLAHGTEYLGGITADSSISYLINVTRADTYLIDFKVSSNYDRGAEIGSMKVFKESAPRSAAEIPWCLFPGKEPEITEAILLFGSNAIYGTGGETNFDSLSSPIEVVFQEVGLMEIRLEFSTLTEGDSFNLLSFEFVPKTDPRGGESKTLSVPVNFALSIPKENDKDTNKVSLTWDYNLDELLLVEYFEIQRRISGNDEWENKQYVEPVSGQSGYEQIFFRLSNDSTDYRILAHSNTIQFNDSDPSSAETAYGVGDEPVAPSDFNFAVVGSDGVQLNWEDNSDNETGFYLDWLIVDNENVGPNGAGNVTLKANQASYFFEGLDSGKRYYFKLRAIGNHGNSEVVELSVTTSLAAKPSNLKINLNGPDHIGFDWAYDSSDPSGFMLRRSTVGFDDPSASNLELAANKRSHLVKSLEPGTMYYFTLAAINNFGVSESVRFKGRTLESGSRNVITLGEDHLQDTYVIERDVDANRSFIDNSVMVTDQAYGRQSNSRRYAFLEWDISKIPEGAFIDSANMTLHLSQRKSCGGCDTMEVIPVTLKEGKTFNDILTYEQLRQNAVMNLEDRSLVMATTDYMPVENSFWTVDIAGLVELQRAQGLDKLTIAIRNPDRDYNSFHTEETSKAENRPKLAIEYRLSGPAPALAAPVKDPALDVLDDSSGSPVRLIILAGQSNMVGYGTISSGIYKKGGVHQSKGTLSEIIGTTPKYSGINSNGEVDLPNVKMINLGDEMHEGFFGPELSFAHEISSEYPGEKFILLKTAWGARNLTVDFKSPNSPTSVPAGVFHEKFAGNRKIGRRYNDILCSVSHLFRNIDTYYPEYSGEGIEIDGIMWNQGWGDRTAAGSAPIYGANLNSFIEDIRSDLSQKFSARPNIPFVIGVSGHRGWNDDPNYAEIWKAQNLLINAQLTAGSDFSGIAGGNVRAVETRDWSYPKEESPYFSGEHFHWHRHAMPVLRLGSAFAKHYIDMSKGGSRPAPQLGDTVDVDFNYYGYKEDTGFGPDGGEKLWGFVQEELVRDIDYKSNTYPRQIWDHSGARAIWKPKFNKDQAGYWKVSVFLPKALGRAVKSNAIYKIKRPGKDPIVRYLNQNYGQGEFHDLAVVHFNTESIADWDGNLVSVEHGDGGNNRLLSDMVRFTYVGQTAPALNTFWNKNLGDVWYMDNQDHNYYELGSSWLEFKGSLNRNNNARVTWEQGNLATWDVSDPIPSGKSGYYRISAYWGEIVGSSYSNQVLASNVKYQFEIDGRVHDSRYINQNVGKGEFNKLFVVYLEEGESFRVLMSQVSSVFRHAVADAIKVEYLGVAQPAEDFLKVGDVLELGVDGAGYYESGKWYQASSVARARDDGPAHYTRTPTDLDNVSVESTWEPYLFEAESGFYKISTSWSDYEGLAEYQAKYTIHAGEKQYVRYLNQNRGGGDLDNYLGIVYFDSSKDNYITLSKDRDSDSTAALFSDSTRFAYLGDASSIGALPSNPLQGVEFVVDHREKHYVEVAGTVSVSDPTAKDWTYFRRRIIPGEDLTGKISSDNYVYGSYAGRTQGRQIWANSGARAQWTLKLNGNESGYYKVSAYVGVLDDGAGGRINLDTSATYTISSGSRHAEFILDQNAASEEAYQRFLANPSDQGASDSYGAYHELGTFFFDGNANNVVILQHSVSGPNYRVVADALKFEYSSGPGPDQP